MSGVEFLEQARALFPAAKRALLTAYADTVAAITAAYEGIRVIGHRWSAAAHALKDFLGRNGVPYQWLDVESAGEEARALLRAAGCDDGTLPVVLFPDGTRLVEPTPSEIARRIDRRTRAERPFYDLAIVGGGPAGLAAAVYGASEGLETVLVEREAPGGQAGTSSRIENYLGFPAGLSGGDLARRAVTQAQRFGVEILSPQEVTSGRPPRATRVRARSPRGLLRTLAVAQPSVIDRAPFSGSSQ